MDIDRRFFIGGAAVAASLAASAQAKSRGNGGKAETKALKALEAYMDLHRAEWGLPGMIASIVTRDGFEGVITSGLADVDRKIPVNADHLFQIGSISKMFTALAAYSLIEEGKLEADVKLKDALKGVAVKGGEAITLQHLLNHTSGLPGDSTIFPEGGLWTGFAPGSHWSYSNCGYQLAGMMVEAAAGKPNHEVVQERIIDRLGMRSSLSAMRVADRARYAQGYEPALTDRLNPRPGPMTEAPWVDSDNPAGSIASTPGDMAIFMRFLLGLVKGEGGPLFSDETAQRFMAAGADAQGWAPGARYGNGIVRLTVDGRTYHHHTGGMVSFCSALHIDAEAGVGAFASANVHYALNYRPREVTLYACDLLRSLVDGATPAPPPSPKKTLKEPARFAGTFTAQSGDAFEIVGGADAISMRRGGIDYMMQEAAPGLFACTAPDFAVTGVAFDINDKVVGSAWVGETEYARDPASGYRPATAPELRALSGRYDNDDRWAGPLYVYARDGALWIGNAERLTPLGANEFRMGDETSPERVRFDGMINGRPHRLLFSGTPFVRRFA